QGAPVGQVIRDVAEVEVSHEAHGPPREPPRSRGLRAPPAAPATAATLVRRDRSAPAAPEEAAQTAQEVPDTAAGATAQQAAEHVAQTTAALRGRGRRLLLAAELLREERQRDRRERGQDL